MNEILYPEQKKYLDKFIKPDDQLINEMEIFASENKVPILDRLSVEFLEQLILIRRPVNVLEIGTAIAYSTIRIARNLSKKGSVYTIEKSSDNIKRAKNNIAKSGLGDRIILIEGDALEVMPGFKKKFDFIFLDADKEDYIKLYDLSLRLLKKNGIIFIDNLLWHGFTGAAHVPESYRNSTNHIREFNEFFMNQKNLKCSIIPIGDGIGIGIRLK